MDAVTDGERKKRDTQHAKRQLNMEEDEEPAVERDLENRSEQDTSTAVDKEGSAAGSAYNPENPYLVSNNLISNTV